MGSIGTGLDISSIVSQLVAAEAAPSLGRIQFREELINIELSGYAKLKSVVSGFAEETAKLLKPETFTTRTGSVDNTSIATVAVTDAAGAGNYDLTVTNLARPHKLASQAFADTTTTVGSGTITINFGQWDVGETAFTQDTSKTALTVDIAAGTDTLADIKTAINAANGAVRASIVNDGTGERLLLTSTTTGLKNGLEITVADNDLTDTDGAGLSQLAFTVGAKDGPDHPVTTQAAADALFVIDGLSVTSASNTVSTALEGATLTLKDTGNTKLGIDADPGAFKNQINAFVSRFNTMVLGIGELTGYDQETGSAGELQGEYAPRGILSTIRTLFLGETTVSSGKAYSLISLGFTTGEDGRLKVDDTKIDAALKDNYADMVEFFGATKTGLATRVDSFLDGFLGASGAFESRTDSLTGQLDRLAEDRRALDRRLAKVEKRYRREFSNLELVVASLQSSADFLDRQLASLSQVSTGRR